ncbi:uncharacterized protein LOC112055833 [Bicyclus anynana]|uniref:Uncharacterized protein LOC112055833 n=1 Tax=Bicyclus anynana TaxID=110368 RepID=A0A6J1NYX4_BICAN|nr:uncharacterized protein LOC112055833 [Bicyclus anynana]
MDHATIMLSCEPHRKEADSARCYYKIYSDKSIGEMTPFNSKRKKRGELWTEDTMKAAMNAVQRGHLTQRSAAARYNIPRRTLRDHLKTGEEIKRLGRKPVLTNNQEKDLVSRIKRFASIGIPLTPKFIRKQTFLFCERHDIKKKAINYKGQRITKDLFNKNDEDNKAKNTKTKEKEKNKKDKIKSKNKVIKTKDKKQQNKKRINEKKTIRKTGTAMHVMKLQNWT